MVQLDFIQANDEQALFRISGKLVVAGIAPLLPELLKTLDQHKLIAFDLSKIEAMDLAGFQLLLVLKKAAFERQIRLKYIKHSAVVLELIDLYGVVGLLQDKIILNEEIKQKCKFSYGIQKVSFGR